MSTESELRKDLSLMDTSEEANALGHGLEAQPAPLDKVAIADAEALMSTPLVQPEGRHLEAAPAHRQRSRRIRAFSSNRLAVVGLCYLLILLFISVFAGVLAPHDPALADLEKTYGGVNLSHLLGTDELGRDVLSRLLFATRLSMMVSVASVGGALILAVPLGLVAGYFGGKIDSIVVFLVDVILSIPPLILVFAIAGVLGPSLRNAVIALAIYFTPLFARLVRTETLRIRHSQLGESSRSIGLPGRAIIVRHVLPNILPSLIVQVSLMLGVALLAEAALSFLGLGVSSPDASWGVMLRSSYEGMIDRPVAVLVPGLAIALAVLAWNFLTDGIRDAFGRIEA